MPQNDIGHTTIAHLIQKAAERVGRDAEQLAMRELAKAEATIGRWRTRDAALMAGRSGTTGASNVSYPPAGSSAWRSERLPGDDTEHQFGGRGLPATPTLANPFPPLGPDQQVETIMPVEFRSSGQGPSRDLRRRPRDESGYVRPVRPGNPDDPSEQGLGYQERAGDDFDTADDLDLSNRDPDNEPVGLLPSEHRGEPKDYFLAHDSATGNIGVFRHGSDKPAAWVRPSPGMSTSDYRIAKDRRSGRIAIMRRRQRDRMHRLQAEGDQIRRRPTRDAAHREHQALANLNAVNQEFWRRPQSPSDFWNRRR
jgi:hypothetical protein